MTPTNPSNKVTREAQLRWVPIAKMKVSPLAQRELVQARVNDILANLDLEQIGCPTVNERDGYFFIIDGQHRVEALRAYGFGDDQMQAWTYSGLTEQEEAEKFLKLNDVLAVSAMAKYRVGVQAGRDTETKIDQIVRSEGLKVTPDRIEGGIRAVGTLRRVYERSGPDVLARTLRIIRDAYGTSGFEAPVLDGLGLMCGRYNGQVDEKRLTAALAAKRAGVNGLLNDAEVLRKQTGNPKGHCVAAAAVQIVNRSKGSKLPSWWKAEA